MIDHLAPALIRAITPLLHNRYMQFCCALVTIWWFRYSIVEWLPSLKIPEHDIYSRLMLVWTSRHQPQLSHYSCTLYQNPATCSMVRFFRITADPVKHEIDEMFWVPSGPKLFMWDGYLFLFSAESLKIHVFWINNRPARRLMEIELRKHLRENKLRQYTAHDAKWIDQPRPKRSEHTYCHENLKAVLDDARAFLDSEEEYAQQGRKWKRVYLLHGAPGTGKTAIADVVASTLDVRLYRHASGSTDDQFRQLINDMLPKSVAIFDEFDQLSAAQRGKGGDDTEGSKRQPIKKQTLQSWLSGELGAEGTVIFLTTNFLEKVDEIITRPQRVDRTFHFPAELKRETLKKILQLRYGDNTADIDIEDDVFKGRTAGQLHQFLDNKDYESSIKGLKPWLLGTPKKEQTEVIDVLNSLEKRCEDP